MRELDRLCESYGDLLQHLDPAAASAARSVSADARLAQFDDEALREHVAALRATAAAAEDLEVDALADEIDRTALLDDLRATTARLEEDRPHRRNPAFWVDHLAEALASLLLRPEEADLPGSRARAGAARIAAIPAFLDSARATLARPPLVLVDGALAELGVVGELLVQAAGEFGREAPGGPEALNAAVATALRALARFGHWLRSEVEPDAGAASATLGEARFDRRIHQRYAVRAGASELWRYATRLLDETEAALVAGARELDPSQSWRALLRRLEDESAPAIAGVAVELERARTILDQAGLSVGSGPKLQMTPPLLRGVFTEITYLAPPDSPGAGDPRLLLLADRLSRAALPAIAAATMAGRHLQEGYARRLESAVRRRLRIPIAVEGWALYAEQWMDELGFFMEREARLVRLARLLGAAGALAADVGIHARGMAVRDAMALLTDRAGLQQDEAEIAVRRILARPTDASAAALGRREILGLRAAAGVAADDRAALDRFHAALLGFGGLPPGIAGWGMGLAS